MYKEPELASPPSTQDRFSSLLVPIIMCVLYSTCSQSFSKECHHLLRLISHTFWLLQTSICLFALLSGVMGELLCKFLPEGRAQRRTLEEVTRYTTPRPTLFMLVTPQKHRPTLHHLPFEHLIDRHMCFIMSKIFLLFQT